jgi:hypothetical protein
MKAIDRLFQYFDYKGIRPTSFEKDNGLSNGYLGLTLKRNGDIGSKIVEIVLRGCPDLSQEWLMLGSGPMLKENIPVAEKPTANNAETDFLRMKLELTEELLKGRDRLIAMLEEKVKELEAKIQSA